MKALVFSAYAKTKAAATATLTTLAGTASHDELPAAECSFTPAQRAVFDKVRHGDFLLPSEWPTARDLVRLGAIRPYWAPPHDDINSFYVPTGND